MNAGAIVIGGEHPGLGIARSLGKRGIPICVIDDQHSISEFSKYAKHVVRVNDLRDEEKTVDSVLKIGQTYDLRKWVLFPTRDETVAAFARHRNRLAEFFRVTTPDWDSVQWAWDKKNSYRLAERLGIAVPRTYNPRTEEDLKPLNDHLPLAIKPAVKENFFYATGAKAWRADNPDQLLALFRKAARQIRGEEIMVQEIIPGDGTRQVSYCAFFREGESRNVLIAKRLRQHPREFGRAATYVETIDLPEIEELSERFLKAINFYGLVEIEFKQDPRDGQYKLLDVNARTWGFHCLGGAAGVDFPYILYCDQLGKASEKSRAKAGIGWLRMVTDLPTAGIDILRRDLSLSAYWQSIRRTRAESVFCWQDPLPSVAEVLMLPYLVTKKYFMKARPSIESQAAERGGRSSADLESEKRFSPSSRLDDTKKLTSSRT